ncbi:hypothetical protein BGW36DRAFT_305956, partial [Talaromyces proteolyticus]
RIVLTRSKPKEIYKKELTEVFKKLLKKYYNYIELFIKKEYQLSTHISKYKVIINLKLRSMLKQVK